VVNRRSVPGEAPDSFTTAALFCIFTPEYRSPDYTLNDRSTTAVENPFNAGFACVPGRKFHTADVMWGQVGDPAPYV
jgi:hypothetical protein